MAVENVPENHEDQFGGYEQDFVAETDIPERYLCNTICTKVLRDPHLTSCCGQHFCESCLNNWFTKSKHRTPSCPHCRTKGSSFNHFLDKKLKRDIQELKIRCSNKVRGCEWTGELENLEKHKSENGCGFVEVECSNEKCREIIMRQDLKKHLETLCIYRLVTCKFCGKTGTDIYITMNHKPVCINYPLPCPNNCCGDGIQRKDMPTHREQCPLESVECQFAEAGCSVKVVRKELDKHLTDNQQQHILKLMSAYKETNKELKEVKQELKETKQEIKQAKKELEEVKRELDGTRLTIGKLQSMQDTVSIDVGQLPKHKLDFSEPTLKAVHKQLASKRSSQVIITKASKENGILFCMPRIHDLEQWRSPDFYVHSRKMHLESCQSSLILMASESHQGMKRDGDYLCVEITDCASHKVKTDFFDLTVACGPITPLSAETEFVSMHLEILKEYHTCRIYVTSNIIYD